MPKLSLEELGVNNLTPIDEYNGILFKRDDLFVPFKDVPVSGGKVRQALSLIHNNYDKILNEHGSWIVTGIQVNSPQGIIVAKVAQEFGFRTLIAIGNCKNPENIKENNMLMQVLKLGGRIDYESIQAYDQNLNLRIKEINNQMIKENRKPMFQIKFGINAIENRDAIIESTAHQVQNIPDDLDYLIIPCGSCISLAGILVGLEKYNKKPKNVIPIQIAGYNRRKVVTDLIGEYNYLPYQIIADETYAYSRQLKIKIKGNEYLDPVYEAKAFDWMMKNISLKGKKILFWIIGTSKPVREME